MSLTCSGNYYDLTCSQAINQPAVICYTSGTTANPKGVLLSQVIIIIIIIIITRPRPAFGRLGLGGSLGGNSSHGYTSHASLRAYGAQLGGDSCSSGAFSNVYFFENPP